MKRSLSDSDSEDVFDDDLKASSPSQSCHVTDRKKRRGIIEKRRRDRINNSLSELRRLVPTAFEKQGSAKLEKAEILQMTVDHLKMLHQKGINGYNYSDPHSLAVDYRSIGFRECASEVARYLVTVEGMDLQDPLRLRLLSHLQCFSATKASIQTSSWTAMSTHPSLNSQYGGNTMTSMGGMLTSQHSSQSDPLTMSNHSSIPSGQPVSYSSESSRISQSESHVSSSLHSHMRSALSSAGSVGNQLSGMTSSSGPVQQISPAVLPGLPQLHSQFPSSLNSMMSPSGGHSYSNALNQHPSVKPYRPWGAELAY